jgi:FkbM family methyltransferase
MFFIVKYFMKLIFYIFYKIVKFINKKSYKSIKILNKNIFFFIPNSLTKWRVDTFFSKEPETLEWIDSFKSENKIIFWDIGGNIGLYSIYASLKYKNIEVIAFEPSMNNLRILSRNISINKLENKIKICQFPLTNAINSFLLMKEGGFEEGSALNSFGVNYNYNKNIYRSNYQYKIYGTSINYLLDANILKMPNYIKIDVDGIEDLILEGANKYLINPKLKSLSIEINENFPKQMNKILYIMNKNKFKIFNKKNNFKNFNDEKSEEFKNTFNYIFIR